MKLLPEISVAHLFEQPWHLQAVAELIHEEFWVTVAGASVESMAQRLGQANSSQVPLCLVALVQGQPVGTVNLVDNDDEHHPEWHPWLAGMVVDRAWRGQGVGSALVRKLLNEARRLGIERIYFGTDGPRFYERLGAVVHLQARPGFWFMRFELSMRASAKGSEGLAP